MGIWEESGKEAEDKVRQNKNNVDYNKRADNYNENVVEPRNKFVENNPEYAREHGIEKLDNVKKIEVNGLAHLKDEMVAGQYKSTHYSDRELRSLPQHQPGYATVLTARWEANERRGREEAEKRFKEEKIIKEARWRRLRPWRYLLIMISALLGGVMGIVCGRENQGGTFVFGFIFGTPVVMLGVLRCITNWCVDFGASDCWEGGFGRLIWGLIIIVGIGLMDIKGSIIIAIIAMVEYALIGWATNKMVFRWEAKKTKQIAVSALLGGIIYGVGAVTTTSVMDGGPITVLKMIGVALLLTSAILPSVLAASNFGSGCGGLIGGVIGTIVFGSILGECKDAKIIIAIGAIWGAWVGVLAGFIIFREKY